MPSDALERVLRLVAARGPLLPITVAKELGCNTVLASAMLAQLVAEKKLKISSTKIGGSPVYYLSGQEASLQSLASYLNEKDRQVFGLLRSRGVLRDSELSPLQRVSLRSALRDFAIPLEVRLGERAELFWKWYLLSESEAEAAIRTALLPELPRQQEQAAQPQARAQQETVLAAKMPTVARKVRGEDAWLEKVKRFLKEKGVSILRFESVRRGSEVDLWLVVPSALGEIEHYCKAKSKRRVDEADLRNAFAAAQLSKLPGMLLTDGELTRAAAKALDKFKLKLIKL